MDIIPKSQQTYSAPRPILFPLALGAIVITGLLFIGASALRMGSSLRLEAKKTELREISQAQSLEERTEMSSLVNHVRLFASVAETRKDPLNTFSFIEETVHPGVVFESMNANVETGIIVMSGRAPNFQTVYEQVAILREQEGVSARVQTVGMDKDRSAIFELEVILH